MCRPRRRVKRLADLLPEPAEDTEEEEAAAADEDEDLFVDLGLKAPDEEGARLAVPPVGWPVPTPVRSPMHL